MWPRCLIQARSIASRIGVEAAAPGGNVCFRRVRYAPAICPNDTTRPPFAHPHRRLEMRDRFPLRGGRHHFFEGGSFRPAVSSIVSASSRLASDTFMPPDFAHHF